MTWRRSASAATCAGDSCCGLAASACAPGDGLQEPPAIAQGKAELFEIALAEFRQDIHADVVRCERVRVLLEIVPAQPLAKFAHAMKFLGRAGAPAARNTSAGAHRLARGEPRLACLLRHSRNVPRSGQMTGEDRRAGDRGNGGDDQEEHRLVGRAPEAAEKAGEEIAEKLVASHTPIIIETMRTGATLVTSESPIGDR